MTVAEQALHRGAMVIVAVIAAGLVWAAGFQGFMPLDQSIVWDGAWRILQGQTPFVDFAVPAGLTPILLQAGVFKLAGISWTSYVAHAALANAVFALAVYTTFARLLGRIGPAFVYAVLAAIALYPPMATPYADHHAVLFLSLLVLVLLRDSLLPRRSVFLWLVALACLLLALLSKALPGLLAPLLALLLLLSAWRTPGMARVTSRLTFALSAATVATLVGSEVLRIDLEQMIRSLWTLPAAAGEGRLSLDFIVPRLKDLLKPGLLATLAALALTIQALSGRPEKRASFLGAAILVVGAIAYALLADNSAWFGYGALPIAAGLCHFLLERQGHRRVGWILAGAMAAQAGALQIDQTMTRAANELRRAHWERAGDAAAIDPRLAGLRWALPPQTAQVLKAEDRPDEYRKLLDLLKTRDGAFVLIGDATILYALAGKPSAFPALWLHPGLTYTPGPAFDTQLGESLKRWDVRRIVVDGERTWLGVTPEDFAPLKACMATAAPAEKVGRFRVIELPQGCIQR